MMSSDFIVYIQYGWRTAGVRNHDVSTVSVTEAEGYRERFKAPNFIWVKDSGRAIQMILQGLVALTVDDERRI